MIRLIYNEKHNTFDFEDKFLWFWVSKTAMDEYGDELPCTLTGFSTLQEALDNAQGEFLIHPNCLPFCKESQ